MAIVPSKTARLTLLAVDMATCEAAFAGTDALRQHLGIRLPDAIDLGYGEEPFRYTYEHIKDNPDEVPWLMYLFIHKAEQALVGLGGFRGKPDQQGMVEIGYQIYEPYRGQGLATEAAQGMVQVAFAHPDVQIVQAHTLAEENASVRVLKHCGMEFTGEFNNPDDGLIWQWQVRRSTP